MSDCRERLFREILPCVQGPGQYVGAEWNMVRKTLTPEMLRFCLAFPDTYSVGMSYGGLHVLYGALNQRKDVYAERVFTPWVDMQEQLRAAGQPLCSLETFTPLREFDVLGFSLQYEMGYTNVLDMLELGGIPLLTRDRGPRDTLVVAGGTCTFNPEPLADFVDLFVLGDGEDRINDLAEACLEIKRRGALSREEMLCRLVERVPNSYAPALYEPRYTLEGNFDGIRPRAGLPTRPPERIEAALVEDLENAYAPDRPIVPFVDTVHDRISIEIMRGCTRGCRFCHAGMTRRPVRARSIEKIVALCEAQYTSTGYSEISLASLSTSDYPDLPGLVKEVSSRFAGRGVSVALPSLRVDDQLSDIPAMIGGVRKSALTIAPEAATDRLRRVINKDILEEDLYRGIEAAFQRGWSHVKLYFMVGLPTETDADVAAIIHMAEGVSQLRRKMGKGPAQVNVSVAPFVPKPHTPFQWEPMVTLERLKEIRSLLHRTLRLKTVRVHMHQPERSVLEGVFARGDRRLGEVLRRAHALGCRFDAWDEQFDAVKWDSAFEAAGVRPEEYVQRTLVEPAVSSRLVDGSSALGTARSTEAPGKLPWSHLSAGVDEAFLLREREQALRGEFSPDCRLGVCRKCGAPSCAHRKPVNMTSGPG